MSAPAGGDGGWDFHLRSISTVSRDFPDPASDPSLLHSVRRLHEICKADKSDDLVARVYPQINKLFQRLVVAIPQSQASGGLLFLAILQFFLDFGEMVLHDADPCFRAFFRSCLSRVIKESYNMLSDAPLHDDREFADPVIAEAALKFLSLNKAKMLSSFPSLLPQFFPLLLKLVAWNGENVEHMFLKVFPGLISPGSFLPLFPSLIDLPVLVVALEKVERNSGSLLGSGIASLQKSTAPEMLLALMDEAYTGSSIEDRGGDSGSDDNNTIDVADPLFLDLLKDENDGLAERHATYPGIAAVVQAAVSGPLSERLKQALRMGPRFLDTYFAIALQHMSESLICALLPLLMTRVSTLFPDRVHTFEVQKRLLEFMLAAFQRSPNFVALLKKPIIDRLGEAYDSPAKTELALQLCWAIGEHGGGGTIHKDAARELFESLELLLYENISSSRLGISQESNPHPDDAATQKSSQARLLCFVLTAIAKLATCHRELYPRARVSLAKVARSQNTDRRIWRRACDYLGLMNDPAICFSVLGSTCEEQRNPGIVNWSEGGQKMIAHIPFYVLHQMEGPPFHDFSISDIIQGR